MEHCIEITLAGRKYPATYQGETIGVWRVPECDRWLKANAGAVGDDMLVTTRNGQPAMRSAIGSLAARTVEENEKVSPRWTKWECRRDGVR